MLTLYVRTSCPYCQRTLAAAQELGVSLTEKEVSDPGVTDELIGLGGKRQMPFLVDSDRGVKMYESEDIIEYLRTHYGTHAHSS